MAPHACHALRPTSKAPARRGETLRHFVRHKRADDLDEGFDDEHAPMMALQRRNVKAGKPGWIARGDWPTSQVFPSLQSSNFAVRRSEERRVGKEGRFR